METIDAILAQAKSEYERERRSGMTGSLSLTFVLALNNGGIRDCKLETTKSARPVGFKRC